MSSVTDTNATSSLSRTAAIATRTNPWRNQARNLQNVFSTVLEQAGQKGFASAEPIASSDGLEVEVAASWEEWFNSVSATRYSFVAGSHSPSVRTGKSSDDLREDYKQILVDAYQHGGYAHPQSYLKRLSAEQLSTIQQAQHLAEPIQVAELSEEASLNLLLPPDTHVDLDGNGLTAVGAAQTLPLPDSNTPTEVRDAWERTTESLTDSQQATYQLMMTRIISPIGEGSASTVAPATVETYLKKANDWLAYLDSFKFQIPLEQYQRDQSFWTSFRDNLLASSGNT